MLSKSSFTVHCGTRPCGRKRLRTCGGGYAEGSLLQQDMENVRRKIRCENVVSQHLFTDEQVPCISLVASTTPVGDRSAVQVYGIRLTSAAMGTQQCVVCIVRHTKSLSVAMETKHYAPFAMSGHEIIHTAVNIRRHIRYLILSDFNQNLWFLSRFLCKSPVSNFMNICPVGAGLIHANRWTDTMKLVGTTCYLRERA